jgi:hypothetical protein
VSGHQTTSSNDFWLLGNPSSATVFDPGVYAAPRVGVDSFVAERLSLGAAASVSKFGRPDHWQLLLAPRLGYAVPLSSRVSLWPRVGFTYVTALENEFGAARGTLEALTLEVPFVFTVAPRFFVSLAPMADIGLGGSASLSGLAGFPGTNQNIKLKQSDYGVEGGLGAYF